MRHYCERDHGVGKPLAGGLRARKSLVTPTYLRSQKSWAGGVTASFGLVSASSKALTSDRIPGGVLPESSPSPTSGTSKLARWAAQENPADIGRHSGDRPEDRMHREPQLGVIYVRRLRCQYKSTGLFGRAVANHGHGPIGQRHTG